VNRTLRKIVIATGVVTTFAGAAGQSASVDGTGGSARFYRPVGIASDGAGNLYVSDGIIRKIVVATGAVTTLTTGPGRAPDQPGPSGIASDGAGNLYFANGGTAIWKVATATGALTRVAGTEDQAGSTDGTGAGARFDGLDGIACDGAGNLYVADAYNFTIRKIVIATRAVTTLAGAAGQYGSADGTGAAARFDALRGIASDGVGNLYVADGNTVRKIVIASATVSTVIGSPGRFGVSLGALPASLSLPHGIAVLPTGELAIVDYQEGAVLIGRL
jgi:sugar lactone lactonase YvrE